jgi:geranylgeranyl diphosphate synthase, type II
MMMTTRFEDWLAAQTARVDRTMKEIVAALPGGRTAEVLAYALKPGGKRLRPALCCAAYTAVARRDGPSGVARLACTVELIHVYSLMHDDLPCMDNDDFRRGQPTTHRVFGDAAAMMAGAALIPLAFRVLRQAANELGVDEERSAMLALELANAAGAAGMVGGQVLDLAAEGRAIALDDLELLHRAKTGALIAAAARLGAIAAGGSEEQLSALRAYGRNVGLAFQIADDVLDETSAFAQLGKKAGKDRSLAKATFPAMMGLGLARFRAVEEVNDAVAALATAGLRTPELEALARFAVERDR